MTQSDSRATPAQREMQQAIELFGEIALSLNALLQNQASLSGLMKANDAARFKNKVDALPKDSEERRDNNQIAEQRYGLETFAIFADEPHDFEILAQASRSAAIEAGGKIPALAKVLESERVGRNALDRQETHWTGKPWLALYVAYAGARSFRAPCSFLPAQ